MPRSLSRNSIAASLFLSLAVAFSAAQMPLASLHPQNGLVWQRTSPTAQKLDGPVLYQLLFNASGTPGTVPAFDTNPRHLTNSPIRISSGNVQIGGAGGLLTINGGSGFVTFAPGQTFPGTTGVNSVAAGNSFITIGGTGANPTVGLNTSGTGGTDVRYLQLSGGTMTGNIAFANTQTFPGSTLAGEVTGPTSATVVSNAVSANTASAIVRRDASGNFSAGTVNLAGNLALPSTNGTGTTGVVTVGGTAFLQTFMNNIFMGQSAGNTTTTATFNTAVGASALQADTSGAANSAFGYKALNANTTGGNNNGFGSNALLKNTAGGANNAFGSNALSLLVGTSSSIQGNDNSAFGDSALLNTSTGYSNAAFGFGAGTNNQTGSYNTVIGNSAMGNQANTTGTGTNNVAVGNLAMGANLGGSFNTAVGDTALDGNQNGNFNVAVGAGSLFSATGNNNDAFGYHALTNLATGNSNTAVGDQAGANLATGTSNLYLGSPGPATGGGSESDTIRIGKTQTATFIAGISGATSASGVAVLVNSNGQLVPPHLRVASRTTSPIWGRRAIC